MPNLSKSDALGHLRKVRAKIPELKALERTSREIPTECQKWERDAKVCIENVFPEKPDYVQEFKVIILGMVNLSTLDKADFEYSQDYLRALKLADLFLESMIEEVEKFWPDSQTSTTAKSNKVFVIHGKDKNIRNEVTNLLMQVELEPIILDEQPSQGLTIIEKLEQRTDVGFAVALLTPDDLGSESGEEMQMFRARQNVIFELGFFTGKLGRKHVCVLAKGEIDIPSNYSGVVYIPMDESDNWKYKFAKELRSMGFDIDPTKIT